MMPNVRVFKESPWEIGEDEQLAFGFDTTPWGVTCPLSPSAVIKNSTGSDEASKLTGTATVSACTATCIVTPRVANITAGCRYRFEVLWQDNHSTPNTFEAWGYIDGAS